MSASIQVPALGKLGIWIEASRHGAEIGRGFSGGLIKQRIVGAHDKGGEQGAFEIGLMIRQFRNSAPGYS